MDQNNKRSQTYSEFSYQYNKCEACDLKKPDSNILGTMDLNNSYLTKGIVEYVLSPLDPTITQKKYR